MLVSPVFLRLIKALRNGIVEWPGPKVQDYESGPSRNNHDRISAMVDLFPLFTRYTIGVFVISLILSTLFVLSLLQMDVHLYCKAGFLLFLVFLTFTWGVANSQRTIYLNNQVKNVLALSSNLATSQSILRNSALTFPQFYDQESQLHPGNKSKLRLIGSTIPDFPYLTQLILIYQWDEGLSRDDAEKLAHRAIGFISCAIYDAATTMRLFCKPSPIPNGRRPAWILENEKSPISLTLSDIDIEDRTCQLSIGPMITMLGTPPGDRDRWEKLHTGFKTKFSEINV